MKMILEEMEIEEAISVYIEHKYFALQGKHLEIEFQVGRNPQSVTANLDIVDDDVEKVVAGTPDKVDEKVKPFSDDQQKLPFE